MAKNNLTLLILCLFTAIYILAGKADPPAHAIQQNESESVNKKTKEIKVIKPFSKIKQIKYKTRYKHSEVKFIISVFSVCHRYTSLGTGFIIIHRLLHINAGFHLLRNLRGPPAI